MACETDEPSSYENATEWAGGPQTVYDRLAVTALAELPANLDGLTGLDVGAGTGAATRELLARGCDMVALDRSPSMLAELARQTHGQVPTVIGDIRDLPIRDDSYDLTVAAFVLNHLADPTRGVRELRRVIRRGGTVVATTFGADDHPMKASIDRVLVRYGFVHPAWYLNYKKDRAALIADEASLATVADRGGLSRAKVSRMLVDLADLPVDAAVGYRLGMAHIAPFVSTLDATTRARLTDELCGVVSALPPLCLPMLVVTGRR